MNSSKIPLKLYFSIFIISLASLLFGYSITNVNKTRDTFLKCSDSNGCFPVSEQWWSWIVASMPFSAMIGCLLFGKMAVGRLHILVICSILYLLGSSVLAAAMNKWMLLGGRIFIGLAIGACCIVVPLLTSEYSKMEWRGILGSAHQMSIVTGILIGEIFAYFGLSGNHVWRIIFGLGIVPAISILIGVFSRIIPESPKYLAQKGKSPYQSLKIIRNEIDEGELKEFQTFQDPIETWSFLKLVKKWRIAHRSVLLAVLLHLAQQLSGINAILYYSATLFSGNLIPVLIGLLNMLSTILGIWLIGKIGRRLLLIISAGGMAIDGILFCASSKFEWHWIVTTVSLLVYIVFFAIGMGPIPWLALGELFPIEASNAASTIAVVVNWGAASLVGGSTLTLVSWFGKELVLIPYVVSMIVIFVVLIFVMPETSGRPAQFL